jgi:hypothetical protein
LGFGSLNTVWQGLTWAQRVAQGYTVASTGYGAYNSTNRIANGCANALDALSFAPAAGYGLSKLNGLRGAANGLDDVGRGIDDIPSYLNSSSDSLGNSSKVQEIMDTLRSENISVKINPKNSDLLQEGNVTLDLGDGKNVNFRVETHPLEKGGNPIRHANVEVTRRTPRGKNKVIQNTHITE